MALTFVSVDPFPWDRKDDETPAQYLMFRAYLKSGPKRSLLAAEAMWNKSAAGKAKPAGGFSVIGKMHNWKERAKAYDDWIQRQRDDERERIEREEGSYWERVRRDIRKDEIEIGQALMKITRKFLEQFKAEPERLKNVTLGEMVKLTLLAHRMQRMGANMSLAPGDVSGDDEVAPTSENAGLFETHGEMAASVPDGALPELPDDRYAKPEIDTAREAGEDNVGTQPPRMRP